MRLTAYTGVSTALATGVVLKALHQRANFYSACVYLSQSNANLMILTNLCLLLVGYILFGLQRLLYGRLRPIETEQLYEKAWFAVTETCLAMTIFRGDLGGWFVVMFVCLLVGKVWGWIGEGRVEVLEQQPPSNPRLFHARLVTSLLLSVIFNTFMLNYAINTVLRQARPDMMVMFGFEFAVLAILSISIMARYGISVAEIYIVQRQKKAKFAERRAEIRAEREEAARGGDGVPSEQDLNDLPNEDDIDEMELDVPGWEEKGRWVFYLDLVTDFLKLIVYLSFFAILFTFYGLPIHILRDVVLTMRSFAKRILDFVRYRNATRDMNQRYPDATAEEIAREDVCIICREEMRPWQPPGTGDAGTGTARPTRPTRTVPERLRPKKLPCGHLLHFACLRSWLERQQNCPTCRRPVATVTRRAAYGRMDGAAGERADGAAQGAGGDDPAAANGEAAEGRPRLWVLNLGPIRIGFGAGRGEMLQELDQRVNDGQAQGPQAPANMNLPQAVQPQRFGFGFGVGRPPTPRAPAASPNNTEFNHQNVRNQLQGLEQQINQEINSLMNTADQLQVTRLLQAELARLRAAQSANQATGQGSPPTLPANGAQAYQTAGPILSPTTSSQPAAGHRSLIPNPQISPMVSGDSRLPEGVTLPAGWTLVPLQRAQTAQQQQTADHAASLTSAVMTPYPTQSTASSYFTSTHSPTPSVRPSSSNGNNIQQRDGIGGSSSSAQPTPTVSRRTSQQTALASIPNFRAEEDTTSPKLDQPSEDTSSSSTELRSSPESRETKAPEESPGRSERLEEDREADTVEQDSTSKGKGRAATVEDADEE